jgi:hypothetical protein
MLPTAYSDKFKYLIYKIIKLNKKMSHFYVWLILCLLLIGLCFSAYASGELYNDIDSYIAVHNSLNK